MKLKETIAIEVLNNGNIWMRVEIGVLNSPQAIARALTNTKTRYPKNRIRAVGQNTGSLYDMVI